MPFCRLPLLERLANAPSPLIEEALSRTLVVAVQHLLETTGSLFDTMLRLGLRPEHTFILGKAYSSNSDVARRLRAIGLAAHEGSLPKRPGAFQDVFRRDVGELWSRALAGLRDSGCTDVVILDDGGRCISMVPEEVHRLARVSAVEQTTSGVTSNAKPRGFRVVEVATSAAKRFFESPMISRAIVRRLPPLDDTVRCGVIGLGNVGRCVASHLARGGHDIKVYDRIPSRMQVSPGMLAVESVEQVARESDVLFGCTGDDVFAGRATIDWRDGKTTLVSCSSEDIEYRSLLTTSADAGTLAEWSTVGVGAIENGLARIEILRGGFPFNFDGSIESVPANEIQLTRALLLGGVLQAVLCGAERQDGGGRMLDPLLQRFVVREWVQAVRDCPVDVSQVDVTRSGLESTLR